MINHILLISVVVLSVILASLFAGAETGMYRLSRLRLRIGVEKKQLSFVILGRILGDSAALLLSMLVGTNLLYYLATSIVTYILLTHVQTEHTAEVFATLITTPILFVFAELIPKNIFFRRADSLMPHFAPFLFVSHKLLSCSGVVPFLKLVSRVFTKLAGSPALPKTIITAAHRHHIRAIFADGYHEGLLSPAQTDIINRLPSISDINISSVMTPINKVQTADANSDNSVLLAKLKKTAFTRLPVVEHRPANIVGFINIYDCLSSKENFTDLYDFIKPIRKLPANTIVSDAINIMQSERLKIVLVTRPGRTGREKPIGIVTMKDLVEELLGELTEW